MRLFLDRENVAQCYFFDIFDFFNRLNECHERCGIVRLDMDMEFCIVVRQRLAFCICDVDVVACDGVQYFCEQSDAVGCADDKFNDRVKSFVPGDVHFFLYVFLFFDCVAVSSVDNDFGFTAPKANDLVRWEWRAAVADLYF